MHTIIKASELKNNRTNSIKIIVGNKEKAESMGDSERHWNFAGDYGDKQLWKWQTKPWKL